MDQHGWDLHKKSGGTPFDKMTHDQRTEEAHKTAHDDLIDRRWDLSCEIGTFEGLQSIEIDLTNAYCPVGFCRMLNLPWHNVLSYATDVRCVVLRDDDERMEIEESFWESMDEETALTAKEISRCFDWTFKFQTSSPDTVDILEDLLLRRLDFSAPRDYEFVSF